MSSRASRVAVLKGGVSAEREVSLVSGEACSRALRHAGFEVTEIDAGSDLATALDRAPREAVEAGHPMDPPYVVKPYNEGSSVGVHIVAEGANGPARLGADAPGTVMVEAYVPGRELTVAVMGDEPLAVTDIIPRAGWYDYHAKYAAGGSRHVVPAEVPGEIAEACRGHAVAAHRAIGCRGVSRTDFRWDESRGLDGLVLLETNTQPGMTPTSLVPEQAAHRGIGFDALCRWILEDASCGR